MVRWFGCASGPDNRAERGVSFPLIAVFHSNAGITR
jgi:hypothetical protein